MEYEIAGTCSRSWGLKECIHNLSDVKKWEEYLGLRVVDRSAVLKQALKK
jgi:hypothetical protein